jgi:hypothetical protein
MNINQRIRKLKVAGFRKEHAEVINQLADVAIRQQLVAGPGILLDQTSNGTVVKIDPNFSGNGNNSGKPRWL